jgi:hypothetical protein
MGYIKSGYCRGFPHPQINVWMELKIRQVDLLKNFSVNFSLVLPIDDTYSKLLEASLNKSRINI